MTLFIWIPVNPVDYRVLIFLSIGRLLLCKYNSFSNNKAIVTMADVKNSKLSLAPSPVPTPAKSPIPSETTNTEIDPDADMEEDPDVNAKVILELNI